jgi:hypothetical protein
MRRQHGAPAAAQTIEENDIFTVEGIPNLDPTTRVRASYESNRWSLHDPADPEQRFWLFGYDSGEPSTSSSSSELFISIKASVIEYPVGRQLSEKEIKLTALNLSSGLTLLSVLEHRKKLQMKADPGLQGAATADFADSSANPSGSNSAGLPPKIMDRPMNQPSVWPDHSSYWSVSELQDFDKNIAHFGTDWHAIASNMPTKTHPIVKFQYLRFVEQGRADLEQVAREADRRRERGDYLGPPPTPTPAPERRFMSTESDGNVAGSVLDTLNATEEKLEPTQSAPQTESAPEHAADMPAESRDTKADTTEQPMFSCSIKANIAVGTPTSFHSSLLREAQLTLFPTYYELKQDGELYIAYYADTERIDIRDRIISISRYSDTFFLCAATKTDALAIIDIFRKTKNPNVVDYDIKEDDFAVADQHVPDTSSSKDDNESGMNIGAKHANPTTKVDPEQQERHIEAQRRTSVGRDITLSPDASLLEVKQVGEGTLEFVRQVPDPFDAHGWEMADNDFRRREEEMGTTRVAAGVAETEKETVAGLVATPRGILRPPTKTFPEDPEPIRKGVAPHKDSVRGKDVPVDARWTKIDRRLVNPEALEEAKERFEEHMDCIIVLRVLTKEEIQKLADRTKEIREQRNPEGNVFYNIEQELH